MIFRCAIPSRQILKSVTIGIPQRPRRFLTIMMNGKESKCFVFIDLETHDLYRPRITEICMIAVLREHIADAHLKQEFSAPRVLNKLSICMAPEASIHPTAADITGLSNELLQEYPVFNEQTGTMIQTFIDLLPKPVCLVAHNGHKFDFPVLKNALLKVNKDMPEHLRCSDTLPGFRKVFKDWKMKAELSFVETLSQNGVPLTDASPLKTLNGSTVGCDNLSDQNGAAIKERQEARVPNGVTVTNAAVESNAAGTSKVPETTLLDWGHDSEDEALAQMDLDAIVAEAEAQEFLSQIATPSDLRENCSQLSWSKPVRETPKRPREEEKKSPEIIFLDLDETDSESQGNASGEPAILTPVKVRKDLFPFTEPASYRLEDVYKKLRGSTPVGHRAEADVLSMLECVLVIGPEILEFFDNNNILFADIPVPLRYR
nr:PREDICTED: uncharacterized protein LOC109038063 [Bemisia tabaci]